jgi:hypothetical protein
MTMAPSPLRQTNSQHRVSSIRLADPTMPGHRRFIALWLVDPNLRIISTANVPPQRRDWWLEAVLGSNTKSCTTNISNCPPDILSLIVDSGTSSLHARDKSKCLEGLDGKLPLELMGMVRKCLEEDGTTSLMGIEEAQAHRRKLMEERGKFVKTSETDRQGLSYSFCEH